MKNLQNQKFGHLLVINQVKKPNNCKRSNLYWLCQCDCGNIKICNSSDLVSGHTHSCGCIIGKSNIINLVEKRFGKLIVISQSYPNIKRKRIFWNCLCDCGKAKDISGDSLKAGKTLSCGCYQKELLRKENGIGAFNTIYAEYRRNANIKKISFTLSKEIFKDIIAQKCFYCGNIPNNIRKSKYNTGDYLYNGIDRLDSNKGYDIDNCVPCCWRCNNGKSTLSLTEFKEWINIVYNYLFIKKEE